MHYEAFKSEATRCPGSHDLNVSLFARANRQQLVGTGFSSVRCNELTAVGRHQHRRGITTNMWVCCIGTVRACRRERVVRSWWWGVIRVCETRCRSDHARAVALPFEHKAKGHHRICNAGHFYNTELFEFDLFLACLRRSFSVKAVFLMLFWQFRSDKPLK